MISPCPMCHSTNKVRQETKRQDRFSPNADVFVVCGKCGIEGPYRTNSMDAISAWNKAVAKVGPSHTEETPKLAKLPQERRWVKRDPDTFPQVGDLVTIDGREYKIVKRTCNNYVQAEPTDGKPYTLSDMVWTMQEFLATLMEKK